MGDSAQGEDDEFLAVMRDTRARYVAGFADQLDHMRSLSEQVPGPSQETHLEQLRVAAHRLAGLSGTLGFQDVGTEALVLEALVNAALYGRPFDQRQAQAAIERLSEAFETGLANPPAWAHAPGR
jgi:chemotaxis protein histidine kinase CheA